METSPAIEQLIQRATANSAGKDIVLQLWLPLASELVSIIGENGFHSLFNRSLYLTCQTYPWLADDGQDIPQLKFTDLRACLQGQSVTDAREGNYMLLVTFTRILATLIGEPLTITILSTAWSDVIPDISGEGATK